MPLQLFVQTLTVGLPVGLLSLARIALILFPLLIVLELATEFGWLEKVSAKLAPCCRLFGLPPQAALPLVAGLIIGFTYSAGVILTSVAEGKWDKGQLTRLWIFLGLTHALIEDTAIFAALGLSVTAANCSFVVPGHHVLRYLKLDGIKGPGKSAGNG